MTHDLWTLGQKTFHYRVGRFHLFSNTLRVARLARHFSLLSTDPNDVSVPIESMSDTDVFMIRPHPVAAELPTIEWRRDAVRFVPTQYKRSYVDLTGGFDNYLKTFTPKSRSDKQRKVRRYCDLAGEQAPWRDYRTPDEIADFYRLGRQVAARAWQEGLIGGGLPAEPEYVDDMRRLASQDRCSGHLLFHGPKPVAYIYLVYEGDVAMFEYTGFDPAYRDHSVGKVLLFKTLEGLFNGARYRAFDFGEGEGTHKDAFSTHQVECADIYYFPHRPRALANAAGQATLLHVRRGVSTMVERVGLRDSIDRALRLKRA